MAALFQLPELSDSMIYPTPTSDRNLFAFFIRFLPNGMMLSARVRALAFATVHLLLFALVYRLAFEIRFDFNIPAEPNDRFQASLIWILVLKTIAFHMSGCFHGSWWYITFADLKALLQATVIGLVLVVTLDHFVFDYQIPRAVIILDATLGIIVVGAFRAGWRLLWEGVWTVYQGRSLRSALIIGANHECGLLAQQINAHREVGCRVRGFLSTGNTPTGIRLGQIPVLGNLEDLQRVATIAEATDILVPANGVSGSDLRRLMDVCTAGGFELKIIPSPEGRFHGSHKIPLREIRIDDLLRREPISLDTEAIHAAVREKTVLVTGAGGSIGSEICRQLVAFQPAKIVLVDQAENNVFMIDRELALKAGPGEVIPCVGDVTDEVRMQQIFDAFRPAIVFHAAAHKHVPLMETNVGESLKNNVLGTRCIANLADAVGTEIFVLISTDKAVNPTSVMGVTKQLAERYVHSLSQESDTAFIVVRFGNVLASVGSVVPIFQEQIRNGGPITITDERMRRYFMTIPEASQLVLQAAVMGGGGEIFVFDMGEPVRIVDLAKDLVRLSGLSQDAIEIVYTGMRPGEKIYEELYFSDEDTLPTKHEKLRAAYHRYFPFKDVQMMINSIERSIAQPDEVIRQTLREFVPEYQASERQSLATLAEN